MRDLPDYFSKEEKSKMEKELGDLWAGQFNNSLSPDNHSTGDALQAGIGGSNQYLSSHESEISGTDIYYSNRF
jgi:hypothetical protein